MADYRQQQEQEEEQLWILEELDAKRKAGVSEKELDLEAKEKGLDNSKLPLVTHF